MYDVFRKIHLYSGLVLLLFVMMYFFTGLVLTHHEMFDPGQPTKTTAERPLSYAGQWNADELGAYLKTELNLPGRLDSAKEKNGTWTFLYANVGEMNKVVVPASHDKLTIERTQPTAVGRLIRLHRFHEYKGGPFYILWAIVYDLTSAAMIVFTITGIYMWYKMTQRRLLGWLCLGASFSFTAGMILYFMYAP